MSWVKEGITHENGPLKAVIFCTSFLSDSCNFLCLSFLCRHWLALTDQTLDLEDVEQNAGSRSRYNVEIKINILTLSKLMIMIIVNFMLCISRRFKSSIRKMRDDTWYYSLLEKLGRMKPSSEYK